MEDSLSRLSPEAVVEAYESLSAKTIATPVITCPRLNTVVRERIAASNFGNLDYEPQIELFFKLENLQKTGSFKFRGASLALSRLPDSSLRAGVATSSSGNHAKALATAARVIAEEKGFPIPVTAFMPRTVNSAKINAVRAIGAQVTLASPDTPSRYVELHAFCKETRATLIPTGNSVDVVLGQGTVALEFQDQTETQFNKRLDMIVAPCGSGGLLSGLAVFCAGSDVVVIGGEPSEGGADEMMRGREKGVHIKTVNSLSIADGLRYPVGELNWHIIKSKAYVEALYSVADFEIKAALLIFKEYTSLEIEPSAVVPLAILLYNSHFHRYILRSARSWNIGIVITGGNVLPKGESQ